MPPPRPLSRPLSRSAHVDTLTRDRLPPRELWPVLTPLPGPDRLNCATALLAGGHPGRPCLVSPAGTLTYGQVAELSGRLARVLVGAGLVPGNRVLLRAPNTPLLVACWLAALRAGLVVVTTMPQSRAAELRAVGAAAAIDLALVDDRYADELIAADIAPVLPFSELADRAARADPGFADVPTAADDVALLAFTSGSTGTPKATMHFHRDVLAIADTFSAQVLRPRPDDVFAGSPPIGFTFGLGGLVVFPLRAGAAALLLERATPDVLPAAVAEHGATILFTAPTAYRKMLRAGDPPRGLRRCVSAGEPLPEQTWHDWRAATGLALIDGLGTTELLHVVASAADGAIRPGRIGPAVPGYRVAVLDPEGRPVPDGEPGLLAVRGPTGCRYLADPRQAEYVRGGWNLTGDVCSIEDGHLRHHARSDDMILSAGYTIAGPEVELALLGSPDVAECAVVGRPDPDRTMAVHAYVVLRDGLPAGPAVADRLREHCRAVLAPYKAPRAVDFVTELPRTSTGKVQRFRLRDGAA